MLTVEEIKKCIEEFKPVGFECEYNEHFKIWFTYTPFNPKGNPHSGLWISKGGEYSLFLQRVIEGINKRFHSSEPRKLKHSIGICYSDIEIYKNFDIKCELYFDEYENIDQAKEQAIKYILDKLKEQ